MWGHVSKKKKYKDPEWVLHHNFWLAGDDKTKLEKLSNKIVDKLMDKWGSDIGVLTNTYVPGNVYLNAGERALNRLQKAVPMPWGRNQSFTHGYNAAIRHAERVVREELTRYHGE